MNILAQTVSLQFWAMLQKDRANAWEHYMAYTRQGGSRVFTELLCVNGYDDTSAKPKGKGLPSVGAGWLGKIGFIQAQGDNLYETLMLNLTLLRDGRECWGESKPCWELEAPKSAERTEICCPDNPACYRKR